MFVSSMLIFFDRRSLINSSMQFQNYISFISFAYIKNYIFKTWRVLVESVV